MIKGKVTRDELMIAVYFTQSSTLDVLIPSNFYTEAKS